MTEHKHCEFLLVRYVPDAVKGEFVNIGVVVLDTGSGNAEARFLRDWRRVLRLDPAADLEMLAAVTADIRQNLTAGDGDRQRMLHLLNDSCANTIQVSEPKALLTDSARHRSWSRLLEIYVEEFRKAGGTILRAGPP